MCIFANTCSKVALAAEETQQCWKIIQLSEFGMGV